MKFSGAGPGLKVARTTIGCSKGVAILEDIVKNDFNPNIALEYGFMRALNKPVLILADEDFQRISADVMGILYRLQQAKYHLHQG